MMNKVVENIQNAIDCALLHSIEDIVRMNVAGAEPFAVGTIGTRDNIDGSEDRIYQVILSNVIDRATVASIAMDVIRDFCNGNTMFQMFLIRFDYDEEYKTGYIVCRVHKVPENY